jgi:hypothetical protein
VGRVFLGRQIVGRAPPPPTGRFSLLSSSRAHASLPTRRHPSPGRSSRRSFLAVSTSQLLPSGPAPHRERTSLPGVLHRSPSVGPFASRAFIDLVVPRSTHPGGCLSCLPELHPSGSIRLRPPHPRAVTPASRSPTVSTPSLQVVTSNLCPWSLQVRQCVLNWQTKLKKELF